MILLLETIHEDAVAVLRAVDEVDLVAELASFDPYDHHDVRAIVTRGRGQVTAQVMAAFPDLQVVARCGAGLDNVDTDAAASTNITVVHAPGLTTAAVAEHALMLMLAVGRRLTLVDAAVKQNNWAIREGFVGAEMRGKRLGIVGFGAIGARLAALGEALGMDVVCATRRTSDVGVPRLELDELLRTSDVVQICVPLTEATQAMFGAPQFALMKPSALLINTARGPIVDHDALAEALERNEIAGYGADVWSHEPPGSTDRALRHESTVITPHVAGLTDVTYRAICVEPAEAVASILRGEQPNPTSVYATDR